MHTNASNSEWKPPVYDNSHGVTLVTATTWRNSPNVGYITEKCIYMLLDLVKWIHHVSVESSKYFFPQGNIKAEREGDIKS